jgi:hypothetical protein
MSPAKVRKSVPVTAEDQRDVELLREDTVYQDAYLAVTGHELPSRPSEAEALHALVKLGRSVLAEHVLRSGYAALAAAENDEDRELRQARVARCSSRGA